MPEPATAPQSSPAQPLAAWARVQELICEVTVDLPFPGLKLRDLMLLKRDLVIDSHWQVSADVPLRVNGQLISWGEFEVVREKLAIRLTELA